MPTYVYKCDSEHTFEVTQSMSDAALDECEVCGEPARRVLFAPAVHFKGSGFYTTDYARKGAGKGGNGSDGDGSGSSDSKSEKKSDSSSGGDSGGSGSGSGSESKSDSGSSSKSDSKASSSAKQD